VRCVGSIRSRANLISINAAAAGSFKLSGMSTTLNSRRARSAAFHVRSDRAARLILAGILSRF
jgi:hypothetical protein